MSPARPPSSTASSRPASRSPSSPWSTASAARSTRSSPASTPSFAERLVRRNRLHNGSGLWPESFSFTLCGSPCRRRVAVSQAKQPLPDVESIFAHGRKGQHSRTPRDQPSFCQAIPDASTSLTASKCSYGKENGTSSRANSPSIADRLILRLSPFRDQCVVSLGAQTRESGRRAAAFISQRLRRFGCLAQLRIDAGEDAVEGRAQPVDRDDDGDRDAGGDQSVLDRGGAGRVRDEGSDNPTHFQAPSVFRSASTPSPGRPHKFTRATVARNFYKQVKAAAGFFPTNSFKSNRTSRARNPVRAPARRFASEQPHHPPNFHAAPCRACPPRGRTLC